MEISKKFLKYFAVFGMLYCILLLTGNDTLTWYLKPLLLPILFYAVVNSAHFETKKWLLAALLFCWIGDCVLLFTHKGELYFILGLVSFLIAHVLFIVLFIKQKSANQSFKKSLFWIGFVAATIYLATMLSFLLPSLGDLRFPVIAYALTITIMLKTALKGTFDWNGKSKHIVFLGAALFVLSDSLLAIDKFHTSFESASYFIMITYLMAQFFITSGMLELNAKK
ncbi:lysoplasmalogenase [Flavobacterium sp.]